MRVLSLENLQSSTKNEIIAAIITKSNKNHTVHTQNE